MGSCQELVIAKFPLGYSLGILTGGKMKRSRSEPKEGERVGRVPERKNWFSRNTEVFPEERKREQRVIFIWVARDELYIVGVNSPIRGKKGNHCAGARRDLEKAKKPAPIIDLLEARDVEHAGATGDTERAEGGTGRTNPLIRA